MAFYCASASRDGDRILTTRAEYASNYIALQQVGEPHGRVRRGRARRRARADRHGGARIARSTTGCKLVSLVHVPTQGGLVNPAAEVGRITRAAGIPLLLDACQSVGQMPVDVEEIGCDILSATGRKFLRGPRGTGFLYVRRELLERLEPPFLDLHAAEWLPDLGFRVRSDARRFENWETNYATKIGLGVAVDYALGGGSTRSARASTRSPTGLRERLGAVPGVTVHDLGRERCGIVTFTVDGVPAAEVQRALTRGRSQRLRLARRLQPSRPRRAAASTRSCAPRCTTTTPTTRSTGSWRPSPRLATR